MNNLSEKIEEKQTRREMCRGLVRYFALGGMGLLWAGLYIRSARNSAANSCTQSLPSCGCTQLDQCNLPQAESAGQTLSTQEGQATSKPGGQTFLSGLNEPDLEKTDLKKTGTNASPPKADKNVRPPSEY